MDAQGDGLGNDAEVRCSHCGGTDDVSEPFLAIVKGDTGQRDSQTAPPAASPEQQVVARALAEPQHELAAWAIHLCPDCKRSGLDKVLAWKQREAYDRMVFAPPLLAACVVGLWFLAHHIFWLDSVGVVFVVGGLLAFGAMWGFFTGPFAVLDYYRVRARRAAGSGDAGDAEEQEVYDAEARRILTAREAGENVAGAFDLPGTEARYVLGVGTTADQLLASVGDEWRATVLQALKEIAR